MKEIVDKIHILPLKGVNAYLVDHGKLTLIDTGNPGNAGKILAYIKKIGKQPRDLQNILITHLHTDHTGSLAALKSLTNAKVIMSVEDAELIEKGISFREKLDRSPGLFNRIVFNLFVKNAPKKVEPVKVDQYLQPDEDFLPIGKGFKIISVPGHAKGQKAFIYQDRGGILFAADTTGNLMGLGVAPFYEDYKKGVEDIQTLAQYEFDKMVFGHGKPVLKDAAEVFRKKFKRFSLASDYAATSG